MTELILLYKWTIPAGAVFAGALALLGCQLAARDRAMQTVCVSQGAMLGVLFALGFMPSLVHDDPDSHFAPFLSAAAVSALTFIATDFLARRKGVSKNTLFASIFAILLAMGYLIGALLPALETHMSQIYFGDLATLTEFDAKITLGFGIVALVGLFAAHKAITNQSFELAIFGSSFSPGSQLRWRLFFNVIALAVLCLSVQFLGFLFTIALLFLPTTVLSYGRAKGLTQHLVLAMTCAMAAAAGGFILSLQFTRLPTVPTVTLTLFVLTGLIALASKPWRGR